MKLTEICTCQKMPGGVGINIYLHLLADSFFRFLFSAKMKARRRIMGSVLLGFETWGIDTCSVLYNG